MKREFMKYFSVILTFLLFFILTGCGKESLTYENGDKLELSSVTGKKITLLRKNGGFVLKGDETKLLLLDIFGTFCPPCKKEAKAVSQFQDKNSKDVLIVAFTYYEDVKDDYVVENFVKKYGANYFIVNGKKNNKMVETITRDIKYYRQLQVPFKVLLKDGKYQYVTDIYNGQPQNNFYIGAVPIEVIQKDIDKVK